MFNREWCAVNVNGDSISISISSSISNVYLDLETNSDLTSFPIVTTDFCKHLDLLFYPPFELFIFHFFPFFDNFIDKYPDLREILALDTSLFTLTQKHANKEINHHKTTQAN